MARGSRYCPIGWRTSFAVSGGETLAELVAAAAEYIVRSGVAPDDVLLGSAGAR